MSLSVPSKILLRLALFEPDIPQNTGTLLRLAPCLGVGVDLIEPCGFLLDDRRLRRAALDYLALAAIRRHASWDDFRRARDAGSRLVLLTTAGSEPLPRFAFAADDTILLGRESAGVPASSMPRPTAGSGSPCSPAPDRSTSPWRARSRSPKPCARPVSSPHDRRHRRPPGTRP